MMRRIAKGEVEVGPLDLSARIRRQADARLGSQLVRFASIGLVSTVVFAVLFGLLVGPVGVFGADVLALSVCAVANTAANRRFTFALRGGEDRGRHYASGLVLVVAPLLLNLGALAAIGALGVHSLGARIAVLTAVNGVAAIARFSALRGWVFRQ
jgi:putative flippase GtrA